MDIKKVHGTGGVTPGAPLKSGKKAKSADFKTAFDKALKAEQDKTEPTKNSEEIMNAEKVKEIKTKVKSGYYDRPEVLENIADKLIGGEKS